MSMPCRRGRADGLRRGAANNQQVIGTGDDGMCASDAIAAALWALLKYFEIPEEYVVLTVGFGDDTDSISTITAALNHKGLSVRLL